MARQTTNQLRRLRPQAVKRVLAYAAMAHCVLVTSWSVRLLTLLHKLSKCKLPFQCAHGRPTIVPLCNVSTSLCVACNAANAKTFIER